MSLIKLPFFILFILAAVNLQAQEDDVTFLKNRIKNNYAGYSDVVKSNEYDLFVDKLLKEERQDTFRILSKMVTYFDNPHLRIIKPASMSGIAVDSLESEQNYRNFEKLMHNEAANRDPREGYWINDKNTVVIALKKIKTKPLTFHAYLIETRAPALVPKGFAMMKMEQQKSGKFETDFITPRGGMRAFIFSNFKGDAILTTGDLGKWRRFDGIYTHPLLVKYPAVGYTTSGKLLDSTTYVLTISDFSGANAPVIDSIIKIDYKKIESAKNLILDIRDNSGGTVRAYWPINPFVYTNPYATVTSYTLCSREYSDYLKTSLEKRKKANSMDSFIVNYLEGEIKRIDGNIGKFVLRPADTFKLDSAKAMPKNVGIILNYAVESAAEMMVLDYKHSTKVTTFGEHTMGAVDYLNTFDVKVPSGKYLLTIATAKRFIPNGQKSLDATGIKPDVPISDNVADWVKYVKDYYDKGN
ncbi:S41 family peptidase [Sphingobacterium sp.]|uniref:S41 family peptidase n=1 Tax=Sphingobacterium sp. TaxID=341027 RepID=UPI0031D6155E